MLAHADKYSKAFSKEAYDKILAGKIPQKDMWKYSSYWYADFDGMAYKTMVRQLISKWGIMSIEMQEAYTKDMAEIKENGDYNYIENNEDEGINKTIEINSNENIQKENIINDKSVLEQNEQHTEGTNIEYDNNRSDDDEFFK